MSIKELIDLTSGLADTINDVGVAEDASTVDLETLRDYASKILVIFEEDDKLYKLVSAGLERNIKNDLKTLAVVCHKALPLRKRLEDMLDNIDWWDISDMGENLVYAVEGVEE